MACSFGSVLKTFQNKVNPSRHIGNSDIHRHLGIDVVGSEIKCFTAKHVNIEAIQFLYNANLIRRPKRSKPFEATFQVEYSACCC